MLYKTKDPKSNYSPLQSVVPALPTQLILAISHRILLAFASAMTNILPQSRVLEILLELDSLLQKLPSSLPMPEKGQSRYLKLLSFHPLPSDWLADIGVVGTVNRQLEVIFGTRAFGFKLQERGATLESVIPILQHYLEQFPGDVILQKWLVDLYQAASDVYACPENNTSVVSRSFHSNI